MLEFTAAFSTGFSEPPCFWVTGHSVWRVEFRRLENVDGGGMTGAPRRLRPRPWCVVLPGGPFIYFFENSFGRNVLVWNIGPTFIPNTWNIHWCGPLAHTKTFFP